MPITYRELLAYLKNLTEKELDQTATVSLEISEEALPVKYAIKTQEGDMHEGVLDTGHVVLGVDF